MECDSDVIGKHSRLRTEILGVQLPSVAPFFMTKYIKPQKSVNKPECKLKLNSFDCENIADRTKQLMDEFLKKGFNTEQAFQLTSMVLKNRLG